MNLYIIRHGKAEPWDTAPNDHDRQLTMDGRLGVEAAAKALVRLGIVLNQLISSPVDRAYQTAEIFAKVNNNLALETNGGLSPGSSGERITEMLQHKGVGESVAIFGHNPDFSELVSYLTVSSPTGYLSIDLKVGSVVRVEFPQLRGWESLVSGSGLLRWVLEPKVLRELGD